MGAGNSKSQVKDTINTYLSQITYDVIVNNTKSSQTTVNANNAVIVRCSPPPNDNVMIELSKIRSNNYQTCVKHGQSNCESLTKQCVLRNIRQKQLLSFSSKVVMDTKTANDMISAIANKVSDDFSSNRDGVANFLGNVSKACINCKEDETIKSTNDIKNIINQNFTANDIITLVTELSSTNDIQLYDGGGGLSVEGLSQDMGIAMVMETIQSTGIANKLTNNLPTDLDTSESEKLKGTTDMVSDIAGAARGAVDTAGKTLSDITDTAGKTVTNVADTAGKTVSGAISNVTYMWIGVIIVIGLICMAVVWGIIKLGQSPAGQGLITTAATKIGGEL